MKDLYKALKIRRTATQDEVRAAYLHWAKKLHPDVNSSPDASSQFQEIREAYETLGDPDRRRDYDATLSYTERIAKQQDEASAQASRTAFLREQEQRERERRAAQPKETPTTDPAEMRKKLTDALRSHRMKDAEELALAMTRSNSRDALAWAALGDIARNRGELVLAAKHYAFAVQFDPGNETYLRSHMEVSETLKPPSPDLGIDQGVPASNPVPLALLGVVMLVLFCWVLTDRTPLPVSIGPLTTWTMGMATSFFIAGVTLGCCLSLGDHLDRLFIVGKSTVTRFPPALTLGVVAIVNFWLMALLYLLVGIFQKGFQKSISAMVAGCAAVVLVLSLASAFTSAQSAFTGIIWGGSLAYSGALLGWIFADSVRPS